MLESEFHDPGGLDLTQALPTGTLDVAPPEVLEAGPFDVAFQEAPVWDTSLDSQDWGFDRQVHLESKGLAFDANGYLSDPGDFKRCCDKPDCCDGSGARPIDTALFSPEFSFELPHDPPPPESTRKVGRGPKHPPIPWTPPIGRIIPDLPSQPVTPITDCPCYLEYVKVLIPMLLPFFGGGEDDYWEALDDYWACLEMAEMAGIDTTDCPVPPLWPAGPDCCDLLESGNFKAFLEQCVLGNRNWGGKGPCKPTLCEAYGDIIDIVAECSESYDDFKELLKKTALGVWEPIQDMLKDAGLDSTGKDCGGFAGVLNILDGKTTFNLDGNAEGNLLHFSHFLYHGRVARLYQFREDEIDRDKSGGLYEPGAPEDEGASDANHLTGTLRPALDGIVSEKGWEASKNKPGEMWRKTFCKK